MDGRDRFMVALRGGMPDAAPVFLRDLTLGLDQTGLGTPEVCAGGYDPDKAAASVIALHKRLGQDAVVGCIHFVGMEVESLGGEVRYPAEGIPSVVVHPFQDIIDPHFEPLDMERDGPFPNIMKCYGKVGSELGDRAALVCNVEGPITKAALLRGMENLAMDMHFEPAMAAAYARYAADLSKEFLQAVSEHAHIDCHFIAAASDNPDIFGKEAFQQISLNNIAEMNAEAARLGIPTVFHPHGDLSSPTNVSLLEEIRATGIAGFQFAEGNDPVLLKKVLSSKLCLMGGIDAFSTLLLGPKVRIELETEEFLRTFHPWDGYVFMCSCSLHRGMPLDHVDHLMRCVRGFHKKGI